MECKVALLKILRNKKKLSCLGNAWIHWPEIIKLSCKPHSTPLKKLLSKNSREKVSSGSIGLKNWKQIKVVFTIGGPLKMLQYKKYTVDIYFQANALLLLLFDSPQRMS